MVAAFIPMTAYLLFIWWLDRNEREPFWIMLVNFAWGATGAVILGIIGSIIFQIPLNVLINTVTDGNSRDLLDLSGAIFTAPLVEEFTKGMFLVIMSMQRKFDGVVDGVVYGAAIGLGFGMSENFMYFLSYGDTPVSWLSLVIIRTLFSAVMHCMSQGTFGAFIGFAKFRPLIFKLIFYPAGFFAAVFLHFAWNLTVSFRETTFLGMLFLVLYFFALFAVFQIALYLESRTINKELAEESSGGLIPAEHLNYLPFVSRRTKPGWCPTGVDQKEYVKTCVALALSRYKFKHSGKRLKSLYQREIENYRYRIQMMFYNANIKYYHNTVPGQ